MDEKDEAFREEVLRWRSTRRRGAKSPVRMDLLCPPAPSPIVPTMNGPKLLERYAKGERDFKGADLAGAYLEGADLTPNESRTFWMEIELS